MKNLFIILLSNFEFISCKSTPINQKINKKREGLWIEKYSVDSAQYKSVGKYKNDDPIKKWRYYLDGKIIKREKYKENICTPNIIMKMEKYNPEETKTSRQAYKYHWFYSGDWKFYDDKGKLIITRKYHNGNLVSNRNNH